MEAGNLRRLLVLGAAVISMPLAGTVAMEVPAAGAATPGPHVQLVPLYEYAGSSTLADDWAAACANDAYVIGNGANSGPPTASDADWLLEKENLLPAMESCYPHDAPGSHAVVDGTAIGYIDTDYGDVPVSTIEQEIDEWASFDPRIGGFFFDDASDVASASNEKYYATITDAVHAGGRSEVVWNWGTDVGTSAWPFPAGQSFQSTWPNQIVVFEGSASSFGRWKPAKWESGTWQVATSSGPMSNALAAIVYDTPSSSLVGVCTTIDRLWNVSDNLFEYYVTNGNTPNPYAGLDGYNATEVKDC